MTSKKIFYIVYITISLTLLFFLYIGLKFDPKQDTVPALINKPAPRLDVAWLVGPEVLKQLLGDVIQTDDLKGSYSIVNFWASWCFSCRSEAKELEAMWQVYREKGLKVIGVAVKDEVESALEFAEKYGKTYPLAMDEGGDVTIEWGVSGVPETFILDQNNIIVFKKAGPVLFSELEEKIAPHFLKEAEQHDVFE